MRARHATSFVLLTAFTAMGSAFPSTFQNSRPPDPAAIVSLFRAYADGDVEVVARTLTTRESFPPEDRSARTDPLWPWIDALRGEWRREWRPVQPTFLLELAVAASRIQISPISVATLGHT